MNKILQTLIDTGAILEGHFLLTSGRHSNKYVEKFRVISLRILLFLIILPSFLRYNPLFDTTILGLLLNLVFIIIIIQ